MDKKIKIGIITFQRAHNYGAILQTYALQEFLREGNFDVYVIDYVPRWMLDVYHYFRWNRFKLLHPKWNLMNLLWLNRRKKRYYSFFNFIEKNICLSHSNRLNEIQHDFDVIVIGSDQVWNINNSLGIYDDYYWGQFKTGNKPVVISYAASMGGSWKTADWGKIKKLLKNFSAISVRENYLRDLLTEKCGIQSTCVLDPTLLQPRHFWRSNAVEIKMKNPYLLYYQARMNDDALEYSKRAAQKMNLKFICISAEIMLYNSPNVISAGPKEFLGLIKGANYVITTSFHGTVFCYQFKKNFSSLMLNDGEDGRSSNFLNMLGLGDRLISLDNDPILMEPEWNLADERLQKERKRSTDWLLGNICCV